ncbi:hypothetical protein JZC05_004200 [Salmonella enterica subsp. enterica serovar Oranienburg]|nr:hypothetical protein [Salmonella enterica subsp. enterica serovar Oranienburg]EHE7835189.1 hypothetical protein [Salmonella enterica subsp. enterica serovar Oranienburg]
MENILTELFPEALLTAAGVYCSFYFKRYQASRDQAQKVSRKIEDVLTETAALFRQRKPARGLRQEFSAILASLSQEMRTLDNITSRLPLKWLQQRQRHTLRHAVWLQRYLASRANDSEGEFFLLLHDIALGIDYTVADILASLKDSKRRRGPRLPVNLKTCP